LEELIAMEDLEPKGSDKRAQMQKDIHTIKDNIAKNTENVMLVRNARDAALSSLKNYGTAQAEDGQRKAEKMDKEYRDKEAERKEHDRRFVELMTKYNLGRGGSTSAANTLFENAELMEDYAEKGLLKGQQINPSLASVVGPAGVEALKKGHQALYMNGGIHPDGGRVGRMDGLGPDDPYRSYQAFSPYNTREGMERYMQVQDDLRAKYTPDLERYVLENFDKCKGDPAYERLRIAFGNAQKEWGRNPERKYGDLAYMRSQIEYMLRQPTNKKSPVLSTSPKAEVIPTPEPLPAEKPETQNAVTAQSESSTEYKDVELQTKISEIVTDQKFSIENGTMKGADIYRLDGGNLPEGIKAIEGTVLACKLGNYTDVILPSTLQKVDGNLYIDYGKSIDWGGLLEVTGSLRVNSNKDFQQLPLNMQIGDSLLLSGSIAKLPDGLHVNNKVDFGDLHAIAYYIGEGVTIGKNVRISVFNEPNNTDAFNALKNYLLPALEKASIGEKIILDGLDDERLDSLKKDHPELADKLTNE